MATRVSENPPIVSIVTPVYNGARFLRQLFSCLQGQTTESWEWLAVDDGSTDESLSLLQEFASEDKRVKVLAKAAEGSPAASRNMAISNCRGDYIAFLDQDDLWHPRKLEYQLQVLAGHEECELVFTDRVVFFEKLPNMGEVPAFHQSLATRVTTEQIFKQNPVTCSSAMARRRTLSCMSQPLNTDPLLLGVDEYELWLRLALNGQVIKIGSPLCYWRSHGQNLGHDRACFMNGLVRVHELFAQTELPQILLDRLQFQAQKARAVYLSIDQPSAALASAREALHLFPGFKIFAVMIYNLVMLILPKPARRALFFRLNRYQ